jgi:hypothetical protein
MNVTAFNIVTQLETRRRLLLSLRQPEGCYVQSPDSEPNGLYWGEVDGAPALVPVEHATRVPQTAISAMRVRELDITKHGVPGTYIPLTVAIGEALHDIEAAVAWVKEGGGG